MRLDLTGKVALVTGAGVGIGAAAALRLAEAGADVALHYRGHGEHAENVAAAARALGRRAACFGADFAADPGGAAVVVEQTVATLGRVDILVNNAADTTNRGPFETHSRALFEAILAVNVTAPFLGSQAAANHMIAQGTGGRIVNVGSIHARASAPGRVAYEVSKGALEALTMSSAAALGKYGITVNCVAPGVIEVERYAEFDFDRAWYESRTPVGRLGVPDDVAAAIVFLAAEQAGFITGETLCIDGGVTRRMSLIK